MLLSTEDSQMCRQFILTIYRKHAFIKRTKSCDMLRNNLHFKGEKACIRKNNAQPHKIHSLINVWLCRNLTFAYSSSAGTQTWLISYWGEKYLDITVEAYLSKWRCLCFSWSPCQFPTARLTSHVSYTQQWAAYRGREGSIVSTESIACMMNDECQVMCSIDIRFRLAVFVRTFL